MGCSSISQSLQKSESYVSEYEKSLKIRKLPANLIQNEYYNHSLHLNSDLRICNEFFTNLGLKYDIKDCELMKRIIKVNHNDSGKLKFLLLSALLCQNSRKDKIKYIFDIYNADNTKGLNRFQIRKLIRHIHEISCNDITLSASNFQEIDKSNMIFDYSKTLNKNKDILVEFFTNSIVTNEFVSYKDFHEKMRMPGINILLVPELVRKFSIEVETNIKNRLRNNNPIEKKNLERENTGLR